MSSSGLRIALVGESSEHSAINSHLKSAGAKLFSATSLKQFYSLYKKERIQAVFIEGTLAQSRITLQIKKNCPHLVPIYVHNVMISANPSKSSHLALHIWKSSGAALIQQVLNHSVALSRKNLRLQRLRVHQSEETSFSHDPVLSLLSQLVRQCALVSQASELIQAGMMLGDVVPMTDWLVFARYPQKIVFLSTDSGSMEATTEFFQITTPENSAEQQSEMIVASSTFGQEINKIYNDPWSSAIYFSTSIETDSPTLENGSICFLFFRNDLLHFSKKDRRILEIALGPLALAAENLMLTKKVKDKGNEWRSTFDSISEPMTIINSHFEIVKANRAFAKGVGRSIQTIKGSLCYNLLSGRRSPCPSCPRVGGADNDLGNNVKGKKNAEYRVWSYDVPLPGRSHSVQFYRNVSNEQQLQATLIQSQKMAAIGTTISAIAHEINNPIGGILAVAQLAAAKAKGNDDNSQLIEDLNEIIDAGRRSKEIVANLLGFSSEDSDDPMELEDLVKNVLVFAKSALRGITLQLDLTKDLSPVLTNKRSIQQILFNLITNASQAMPKKGTLKISAHSKEDTLFIEISDSGKGMTKKEVKEIFQPMYTQKRTGTGLGLYVVKMLVKRMNGEVSIKSRVGKGSNFLVEIPWKELNNGIRTHS